jgi:hypothetical protein
MVLLQEQAMASQPLVQDLATELLPVVAPWLAAKFL